METGKFWVAILVCLSAGMCGHKYQRKQRKKLRRWWRTNPDAASSTRFRSFNSIAWRFPPILYSIFFPSSPNFSRCHFSLLSKCTVLSQPFVLSLSLLLSILHRPYMGYSQTKHIKTLGSKSPVSTRHKTNSINLRALFAVRYRRHWLKSHSHDHEDIKTINTQISDNFLINLKIKAAQDTEQDNSAGKMNNRICPEIKYE